MLIDYRLLFQQTPHVSNETIVSVFAEAWRRFNYSCEIHDVCVNVAFFDDTKITPTRVAEFNL